MPTYYFDIDDGERSTRDEQGQELPDHFAARDAALAALPSVALDVIPDADRRVIAVTVRNEECVPILHATLTLVSDWLE